MQLVGKVADQIRSEARQLIKPILAVFWLCICGAYIAWWEINDATRRALTGSVIIVLLVASGAFLVELGATFFGDEIHLPHLPLWLQIVVVGLAAAMVIHRVREWRHFQHESLFATTVAKMMPEIAWLNFDSPDPDANLQNLDEFIEKVVEAFGPVFDSHGERIIVMLRDEADGLLKVKYYYPGNAMYNDSVFEAGQGGAGKALEDQQTLYFPAIRYRHGIAVIAKGDYDLRPAAYHPTGNEGFKSVICAPISCGPHAFGVINVDSRRQNAFTITDCEVAQVAGATIGMAIDRYVTSL